MKERLKRRWFLIPATVAVLVIGVLGFGVVAAQVSNDEAQSSMDRFTARVAKILGLDQDDVEAAMTQAKEELRDEAIQGKLDAMVAAGQITQEQADEYKAWLDSRPEGLDGKGWFGGGRHGRGFHRGRHGGKGHGFPGWKLEPPDTVPDTEGTS